MLTMVTSSAIPSPAPPLARVAVDERAVDVLGNVVVRGGIENVRVEGGYIGAEADYEISGGGKRCGIDDVLHGSGARHRRD
jgi:hypothetical protein